MIGVAARAEQLPWVSEFFELFKTAWEPVVGGKRYRAVLIADAVTEPVQAPVAFVYGAASHPVDTRVGMRVSRGGDRQLAFGTTRMPAYGDVATFEGPHVVASHGVFTYAAQDGPTRVRRVGYDLFTEIAHLLTAGQPLAHADVPTLEHHASLLRAWLREEAVPFVEVPPRPAGYDFTCCLTHDIDFFGIRRHALDRTLAGFIARGTVHTTVDLLRGRRTVAEATANYAAVATLPLVMTGLARDLWHPFDDYKRADRGRAATYFLVPFKEQPGISPAGVVESHRGVAYEAQEIADEIRCATGPNVEFAVHGLDAWRDADAGRRERAAIAAASGAAATGVRMHWLYYDQQSPQKLEAAGFTYDSTWGYNDSVGFRAGTMQAFKLAGTRNLLELPLTVMDTAMLYPDRMGLSPQEAYHRSETTVTMAAELGGALVVNWHDRSLAPERQWGMYYEHLLNCLEQHAVWYATAGDAVAWFQWRRSIRFEPNADGTSIRVTGPEPDDRCPAAPLVLSRPDGCSHTAFPGGAESVSL